MNCKELRYFFIYKLIKCLTPNLYLKLKKFHINGFSHMPEFKFCYFKGFIRPFISFIKKHFKTKKLIGVEIGVYKGNNALAILKNLNIEKLYLIDIWQIYNKIDNFINYDLVKRLFRKDKRVKIIRDYSIEISKSFKDNSLDFVYIDANHQYNYVYDDIKTWYKKIKINGVLCGHDIFIKDVFRALCTYCIKNEIMFFIEPPDWFIIKKKKK